MAYCQPSASCCPLPVITWKELYGELRRKQNSSAGPDAIGLLELRALPAVALKPLVDLFSHVECGGAWPESLLSSFSHVLPKAAVDIAGSGLQVRLITVTSHVYRLWSSYRVRCLSDWVARTVDPLVFGGVKGRSSIMCSAIQSMLFTRAEKRGDGFTGLSFDCTKCFDSLPVQDLVAVAVKMGLPAALGNALLSWYSRHVRLVNVRGWVSELVARRGICQGDPLSVVLAVLWAHCFVTGLSKLSISVTPTVFFDDFFLGGSLDNDLCIAAGFFAWFVEGWRVAMNASKTVVLQNTQAKLEGSVWSGAAVPQARVLGIDLGEDPEPNSLAERCEEALQRIAMSLCIRLGQGLFRRAAEVAILPVLFGSSFVRIGFPLWKVLCSNLWPNLVGVARYAISRPLVLSLRLKAHCVWPDAVRHSQVFAAVRMLSTHPYGSDLLDELWSFVPVSTGGLWKVWTDTLADLGVTPLPCGRLFCGAQPIACTDMSRSTWMHVARRLWKERQLLRASARLCEDGERQVQVDLESSRLFLRKAQTHTVDSIQAGGVNSMDRQQRHLNKGDGVCEHQCGTESGGMGVVDSFWHKLATCVATQELRQRPGVQDGVNTLSSLPRGFREHMLVPW
eukprot:6490906-Amphidinium_carterae.1